MAVEVVENEIFDKIRSATNGMLSSKVYKAIYEAARDVARGVYLDIGPAQGGSTISIALGRGAAGRQDLIYSADVFTASNALKGADVDANVGVLKANLSEFGFESGIEIIVVGRQNIATAVPLDAEIGLFFVDADGALDRDFDQFYDRIRIGSLIILDDYEDKVVRKYVEFPQERLDRYVKSKGADEIASLTPLGKHYSVYKFANKLIDMGMLEEVRLINNTLFVRKIGNEDFAKSGASEALADVRREIAKEFFDARDLFSASIS